MIKEKGNEGLRQGNGRGLVPTTGRREWTKKKKNTTEVEPTVVPLNQKQWETWKLHRYWDFITGDSKSVSIEGLIKL